jgi:hypothetical protein
LVKQVAKGNPPSRGIHLQFKGKSVKESVTTLNVLKCHCSIHFVQESFISLVIFFTEGISRNKYVYIKHFSGGMSPKAPSRCLKQDSIKLFIYMCFSIHRLVIVLLINYS